MNTTPIIQRCIDRCAAAKDGRGRWRAHADCVKQLADVGCAAAIAQATAGAARRIGEWLANWPGVQAANPSKGQ